MSPNDDALGEATDETACGHPACACAAGPSGYCSAGCEAQGDANFEDDREECACGHPDCEASAVDMTDLPG